MFGRQTTVDRGCRLAWIRVNQPPRQVPIQQDQHPALPALPAPLPVLLRLLLRSLPSAAALPALLTSPSPPPHVAWRSLPPLARAAVARRPCGLSHCPDRCRRRYHTSRCPRAVVYQLPPTARPHAPHSFSAAPAHQPLQRRPARPAHCPAPATATATSCCTTASPAGLRSVRSLRCDVTVAPSLFRLPAHSAGPPWIASTPQHPAIIVRPSYLRLTSCHPLQPACHACRDTAPSPHAALAQWRASARSSPRERARLCEARPDLVVEDIQQTRREEGGRTER